MSLQNNPEIDRIVAHAIDIAKAATHKLVTTEHLALALVVNEGFKKILIDTGIDTEALTNELSTHLLEQVS